MSYYEHIDDFEGIVPLDNAMPADVKRLISHTSHNYLTRYYFYSPSTCKFYRYYLGEKSGYELSHNRLNKNGIAYHFIPDEDEHKRDTISVSDRFKSRVQHMNKLILPKI